MKNKILMLVGAGIVCLSLAFTTHAAPINGTIDINGGITTDPGDLATATQITSFFGTTVLFGTGDYLTVPSGQAVTMNPLTFTPSTPVSPLWTFTIGTGPGAITYSFDLSTVTVETSPRTSSFLDLSGTGTAHITGFDDTPGTWVFSTQSTGGQTGGRFSFSSETTAASVPDGGLTALLLGSALVGIQGLRRKMKL